MNKVLNIIKARRVRRQQLLLERWERERAKGKARFVVQQALTFSVLMTGIRDVSDQIFDGGSQVSNLWFHLIVYSLAGIVVGLFGWSGQESKYKHALLNRRLQMPFDDRIAPR